MASVSQIRRMMQMATPHQESVTDASIASFTADFPAPMGVKAEFSPVQDLHGYDSPWPAGGGKNKLPPGQTQTANGITLTVQSDGSYVATGTATGTASISLATISLQAGQYVLNGLPAQGRLNETYRYTLVINGSASTFYEVENPFTLSADSTVEVVLQFFTGFAANSTVFKPMIRLSSVTDATFAPYSNVCPISGRTGANIYNEETYDASATPKLTINWQSSAGTVYGGYVQINEDGSGVLVADRAIKTYNGSETWTRTAATGGYQFYTGGISPLQSSLLAICDRYITTTSTDVLYARDNHILLISWRVAVHDNRYTEVEDFKAYLAEQYNNGTPLTVCYILSNPTTYPLSADQLRTLLGTNNVWTDLNGDVTVRFFKHG